METSQICVITIEYLARRSRIFSLQVVLTFLTVIFDLVIKTAKIMVDLIKTDETFS